MAFLTRRSVSLALLASAAGATGARAAAEKEPFTFGVALPMTGLNSNIGIVQVEAIRWAVADINAKGGANGRPLKVAVVDTQSDPKLGIDVVTQLISVNSVPLVVAAISPVVAATAPIANRSKVLMLVTGAQSPRIADMGEFVYTTYPLADVDVTELATYLRKEEGKKRAAVIYIYDEAGIYGARLFRDTFEKLGGEVAAFESYESKASDYTGAILKLRLARPDVIHIHGNAGETPQVIQQLRQLGLTMQLTSYIAAYNPRMIEMLGSQANGLLVPSFAPSADESPAVATYLARWIKQIGHEPDVMPASQFVHDDAYIVKALVENLDAKGLPLTGENLRLALLEIGTFDTPLVGKIPINANHTVRMPAILYEAQNGKFVRKAVFDSP